VRNRVSIASFFGIHRSVSIEGDTWGRISETPDCRQISRAYPGLGDAGPT
jgi:hypothetical protein